MPESKPLLIGASSSGSLFEIVEGDRGAEALRGLFCCERHEDLPYKRSGYVKSVVNDIAMVQFFSAFDGASTTIEPVPVSELLGGGWFFYDSYRAYKESSALKWERYYDSQFDRTTRPDHEVIRSMWSWDAIHYDLDDRKKAVDRIMDGADPAEVFGITDTDGGAR